MSYCNIGNKPKVYFQFGQGKEQIYESKESPIDVSMEDYSIYGENYNPTGFTLTVYSTNNFKYVSYVLRNYQVIDRGTGVIAIFRYLLMGQTCASETLESLFNIDPSTIQISQSEGCPTQKPDKKKSRLHVKKAGVSSDTFTAEGEYPGKFRVACADCPPGTCRCECEKYPGYCCLPCDEVKGNIRAITESVKRLNHG